MKVIKANDRVFFAGHTGSGKTFLARRLTNGFKRLIVIDTKGTLGEWGLDEFNEETARKFVQGEDVRARVLSPIEVESVDYWNQLFLMFLSAGDCTIYLDELIGVTESGTVKYLKALYTRGRELGIGVWSATQRPHDVPLYTMSESDHFFCFYLVLKRDRQRMSEFMGEEVLADIRDEHGFYYSRKQDRNPKYVRQFKP